MATLNTDLELKITALVQGIQDVTDLGAQFIKLKKEAEDLKSASGTLDQVGVSAKTAALGIEQAFSALGGKSLESLNAEIEHVHASLTDLKGSGAPIEEIAQAETQATAQLVKLNQELASTKAETAVSSLNTLRTALAEDQKGFQNLATTSKVSFDEINVAVETLGNRSLGQIAAEITRVKAALDSIKGSGAPFEEVARAEALAQQQLVSLGGEFKVLLATAETTGQDLGKVFTPLESQISQAETEILSVKKALDTIASSGAGFEVVAAAEQLAITRTAELSAQLIALRAKADQTTAAMNQDFATLGGRSIQAVTAEINRVQQALVNVRNSGASFEEIERAAVLAERKVSDLNQELENVGKPTIHEAFDKLLTSIKSLDFKGATQGAKELFSATEALGGGFGQLAIAGLIIKEVAKAFVELVGAAKAAADYAAKVETLAVTLNVVGRNAGYSTEELKKFEKQIHDMGITTEVSRQALLSMIQAGINVGKLVENTEKAGTKISFAAALARGAQDLAVTSGENSSDTLRRLVINIQQMDTQGLRFQGILVNAAEAQARFATANNVSVASLGPLQKAEAFQNETLFQLNKLTGAYSDALETTGKKLQSLDRYQKELSNTVGGELLPAYGALVDGFTEFLKVSDQIVHSLFDNSHAAQELKDGLKPIAEILVDIGKVAVYLAGDVFRGLFEVVGQVGGLIGDIYQTIKGAVTSIFSFFTAGTVGAGELLTAVDPIKGFFTGLALIIAGVRDAFTLAVIAVDKLVAVAVESVAQMLEYGGKLIGFFNADLGNAIQASADNFHKFSRRLVDDANSNSKALENGQGALAQFANNYGQLGDKSKVTSQAFKDLTKEVSELAQKQRDGKISTTDLEKAYSALDKKLLDLRATNVLSTKEASDAAKALASIPGTFAQAFQASVEQSKLTLGNLRSNVTLAVTESIDTLDKIIQAGASKNETYLSIVGSTIGTIQADVVRAINKIVGEAKTLEDLIPIADKIKSAFDRGVITEGQFADGLLKVHEQFDKFTDDGIKVAKTTQDFTLLRDRVEQVGKAGNVGAAEIAINLKKVSDAAKNAAGEYTSLEKAIKAAAVSSEQVKLEQARFSIIKDEIAVAKDRVNVWIANNAYARTGSEIDRLALEAAKAQLTADQEQLVLNRLRYDEEKLALQVILTTQEKITLEKRLQAATSPEEIAALEAQKLLLTNQLEQQETGVQQLKAQVDQQIIAVTEAQILEAVLKGQLDIEKTVTTEIDKQNQGYQASAKGVQSIVGAATSLSGSIDKTAGGVRSLTTAVQGTHGAVQQVSSTFGSIGPVVGNVGQAVSGLRTGVVGIGTEAQKVGGAIRAFGADATNAKLPFDNLNANVTILHRELISADEAMRKFGDTGATAFQQVNKGESAFTAGVGLMDSALSTTGSIFNSLESSVTNFVSTSIKGFADVAAAAAASAASIRNSVAAGFASSGNNGANSDHNRAFDRLLPNGQPNPNYRSFQDSVLGQGGSASQIGGVNIGGTDQIKLGQGESIDTGAYNRAVEAAARTGFNPPNPSNFIIHDQGTSLLPAGFAAATGGGFVGGNGRSPFGSGAGTSVFGNAAITEPSNITPTSTPATTSSSSQDSQGPQGVQGPPGIPGLTTPVTLHQGGDYGSVNNNTTTSSSSTNNSSAPITNTTTAPTTSSTSTRNTANITNQGSVPVATGQPIGSPSTGDFQPSNSSAIVYPFPSDSFGPPVQSFAGATGGATGYATGGAQTGEFREFIPPGGFRGGSGAPPSPSPSSYISNPGDYVPIDYSSRPDSIIGGAEPSNVVPITRAQQAAGAAGSTTSASTKTLNVNLTLGNGKVIPLSTDVSNEQALVNMFNQLKKASG